jgi:hypothetical protein
LPGRGGRVHSAVRRSDVKAGRIFLDRARPGGWHGGERFTPHGRVRVGGARWPGRRSGPGGSQPSGAGGLRPGVAGARRREHDDDLHPRAQPGRPRGARPAGPPGEQGAVKHARPRLAESRNTGAGAPKGGRRSGRGRGSRRSGCAGIVCAGRKGRRFGLRRAQTNNKFGPGPVAELVQARMNHHPIAARSPPDGNAGPTPQSVVRSDAQLLEQSAETSTGDAGKLLLSVPPEA